MNKCIISILLILLVSLLAGCASQVQPQVTVKEPVVKEAAPVQEEPVVETKAPVVQNKPTANTCGDGICAGTENCDRCAKDCSCKSPAECYRGACKVPECGGNPECKDNDTCTVDTCEFAQHPNAYCLHELITEIKNNDGCCPRGATSEDDTDCEPVCGNHLCEVDENSDSCPKDCPEDAECGNGHCEDGEDNSSCPADCP